MLIKSKYFVGKLIFSLLHLIFIFSDPIHKQLIENFFLNQKSIDLKKY